MPEKMIPEHIDPFRFAEQSLALDGAVKLAGMERLCSNLSSNEGAVNVQLRFGIDDQGLTFLHGHLEGTLMLRCQRCMEPYSYGIMSDFSLGIVNTLEEANALPGHYEPALVQDSHIALRELIEDELILNLPIIPRHAPDECTVKLPLKDSEWEEGEGGSPFRILESLKERQQ